MIIGRCSERCEPIGGRPGRYNRRDLQVGECLDLGIQHKDGDNGSDKKQHYEPEGRL